MRQQLRRGYLKSVPLARWLVTALVLSGCDDSTSTSTTKPDPGIVVDARWGAGSADLGQTDANESAPAGPSSFAVGADGKIWVLDPVNARIQAFSQGKHDATVPLAPRPFVDIALDGDGFVVVDLHAQPAIVIIGDDGSEEAEVALPGLALPEPSRVTALERRSDGAWLEVDDDYSVQITDGTGAAVEREVVPGTLAGEADVLRAVIAKTSVSVFRQPLSVGPPALVAEVSTPQPIRERTLLAEDSAGRVLLGLITEAEQPDPETPPEQAHVLVVLDSGGGEIARHDLPLSATWQESFRRVKLGADDNVYALRFSAEGAQVLKVEP